MVEEGRLEAVSTSGPGLRYKLGGIVPSIHVQEGDVHIPDDQVLHFCCFAGS